MPGSTHGPSRLLLNPWDSTRRSSRNSQHNLLRDPEHAATICLSVNNLQASLLECNQVSLDGSHCQAIQIESLYQVASKLFLRSTEP